MPTGFAATQFAVTEENEVLVITLGADSTEEDDYYLMLQHQEEYTEQDTRFGMDKPYIEYCDQEWSWYGHIEGFKLYRDRVVVTMDSLVAGHMGNDGIIGVNFSLSDQEFARLQLALEKTFQNSPYYANRVLLQH